MKLLRRIASVVLLGAAAACSSGPDQGVVTGDLFVATAGGEQIDLLGRRVHLLPDEERVDSALVRICASRRQELTRVPRGAGPAVDSLREAAVARAWTARERALARLSRRSATTRQGARFALDSVPSGEYRLWADAVVQGERWTWLERVRVRGGDTLRVSLSNANADDDPFRCQHRLARQEQK